MSRSVTVAVVYVMCVTSLSWRDSLKAVQGARNVANPNVGFLKQLQDFESDRLTEERRRIRAKYPSVTLKEEDEQMAKQLLASYYHSMSVGEMCEGHCPPGVACPRGLCHPSRRVGIFRRNSRESTGSRSASPSRHRSNSPSRGPNNSPVHSPVSPRRTSPTPPSPLIRRPSRNRSNSPQLTPPQSVSPSAPRRSSSPLSSPRQGSAPSSPNYSYSPVLSSPTTSPLPSPKHTFSPIFGTRHSYTSPPGSPKRPSSPITYFGRSTSPNSSPKKVASAPNSPQRSPSSYSPKNFFRRCSLWNLSRSSSQNSKSAKSNAASPTAEDKDSPKNERENTTKHSVKQEVSKQTSLPLQQKEKSPQQVYRQNSLPQQRTQNQLTPGYHPSNNYGSAFLHIYRQSSLPEEECEESLQIYVSPFSSPQHQRYRWVTCHVPTNSQQSKQSELPPCPYDELFKQASLQESKYKTTPSYRNNMNDSQSKLDVMNATNESDNENRRILSKQSSLDHEIIDTKPLTKQLTRQASLPEGTLHGNSNVIQRRPPPPPIPENSKDDTKKRVFRRYNSFQTNGSGNNNNNITGNQLTLSLPILPKVPPPLPPNKPKYVPKETSSTQNKCPTKSELQDSMLKNTQISESPAKTHHSGVLKPEQSIEASQTKTNKRTEGEMAMCSHHESPTKKKTSTEQPLEHTKQTNVSKQEVLFSKSVITQKPVLEKSQKQEKCEPTSLCNSPSDSPTQKHAKPHPSSTMQRRPDSPLKSDKRPESPLKAEKKIESPLVQKTPPGSPVRRQARSDAPLRQIGRPESPLKQGSLVEAPTRGLHKPVSTSKQDKHPEITAKKDGSGSSVIKQDKTNITKVDMHVEPVHKDSTLPKALNNERLCSCIGKVGEKSESELSSVVMTLKSETQQINVDSSNPTVVVSALQKSHQHPVSASSGTLIGTSVHPKLRTSKDCQLTPLSKQMKTDSINSSSGVSIPQKSQKQVSASSEAVSNTDLNPKVKDFNESQKKLICQHIETDSSNSSSGVSMPQISQHEVSASKALSNADLHPKVKNVQIPQQKPSCQQSMTDSSNSATGVSVPQISQHQVSAPEALSNTDLHPKVKNVQIPQQKPSCQQSKTDSSNSIAAISVPQNAHQCLVSISSEAPLDAVLLPKENKVQESQHESPHQHTKTNSTEDVSIPQNSLQHTVSLSSEVLPDAILVPKVKKVQDTQHELPHPHTKTNSSNSAADASIPLNSLQHPVSVSSEGPPNAKLVPKVKKGKDSQHELPHQHTKTNSSTSIVDVSIPQNSHQHRVSVSSEAHPDATLLQKVEKIENSQQSLSYQHTKTSSTNSTAEVSLLQKSHERSVPVSSALSDASLLIKAKNVQDPEKKPPCPPRKSTPTAKEIRGSNKESAGKGEPKQTQMKHLTSTPQTLAKPPAESKSVSQVLVPKPESSMKPDTRPPVPPRQSVKTTKPPHGSNVVFGNTVSKQEQQHKPHESNAVKNSGKQHKENNQQSLSSKFEVGHSKEKETMQQKQYSQKSKIVHGVKPKEPAQTLKHTKEISQRISSHNSSQPAQRSSNSSCQSVPSNIKVPVTVSSNSPKSSSKTPSPKPSRHANINPPKPPTPIQHQPRASPPLPTSPRPTVAVLVQTHPQRSCTPCLPIQPCPNPAKAAEASTGSSTVVVTKTAAQLPSSTIPPISTTSNHPDPLPKQCPSQSSTGKPPPIKPLVEAHSSIKSGHCEMSLVTSKAAPSTVTHPDTAKVQSCSVVSGEMAKTSIDATSLAKSKPAVSIPHTNKNAPLTPHKSSNADSKVHGSLKQTNESDIFKTCNVKTASNISRSPLPPVLSSTKPIIGKQNLTTNKNAKASAQ